MSINLEKYLNEADQNLNKKIADSFTRYVMGDSDAALKELKKYPANVQVSSDASEYNKAYVATYKKFLSILDGLK